MSQALLTWTKKKFACNFQISWRIWVKFGTSVLHVILFIIQQFRYSRCSESQTLLKGINKMLPIFYRFSPDFGQNSAHEISTVAKCEFSKCEFMSASVLCTQRNTYVMKKKTIFKNNYSFIFE